MALNKEIALYERFENFTLNKITIYENTSRVLVNILGYPSVNFNIYFDLEKKAFTNDISMNSLGMSPEILEELKDRILNVALKKD